MTPVGHTLTGLAIGSLVLPPTWSMRAKTAMLAAFVLLANAPDLPVTGWGHDRYYFSHSVFVTTLAVIATWLVVRTLDHRSRVVPIGVYVAGGLAWYSHLLLDTFYNHGNGLAIFWPLGDGRLALPIAWFSTMKLSPLVSRHNLQVFLIEAAVYGTVLALALAIRAGRSRRLFIISPDEPG